MPLGGGIPKITSPGPVGAGLFWESACPGALPYKVILLNS
jgi:hypothetical protein